MPVDQRFATDPLASHSARFPLARPTGQRLASEAESIASELDIRPWNLRGMVICGTRRQTKPGEESPEAADPSAESVSDNDGDEGPSEDWRHDFAPDYPAPAA